MITISKKNRIIITLFIVSFICLFIESYIVNQKIKETKEINVQLKNEICKDLDQLDQEIRTMKKEIEILESNVDEEYECISNKLDLLEEDVIIHEQIINETKELLSTGSDF